MPGDCFVGVGGLGSESMSTVGRHGPILVTFLRLVLPRSCFVGGDINIGDSLRLLLGCLLVDKDRSLCPLLVDTAQYW